MSEERRYEVKVTPEAIAELERLRKPQEVKKHDTRLGRFYPITLPDGEEVLWPSVTTILSSIAKPALVNWAARTEHDAVVEAATQLYLDVAGTPKMKEVAFRASLENRLGKVKAHKRALEAAGAVGTEAHKLIEWKLRKMMGQAVGPEPHVSEAAAWAVMAWEDWARSVELKPLLIEQRIYSVTHHYAGSLDLYAMIQGKRTLADVKTSKGIYGESFLQNASYRVGLREMGHGDPEQGMIIRLPKVDTDPKFEVKIVDDEGSEDYFFGLFLAAKELWWWQYREGQAYQKKRAEKEAARVTD